VELAASPTIFGTNDLIVRWNEPKVDHLRVERFNDLKRSVS
jgi:hypothetical protein